jgi:Ni,Fe-hydrogenase III large subunit/Ni,Fe-hydrogenase III component G
MLTSEHHYEFASLVVEHSGAGSFVARYYFYTGRVLEDPGAARLIEMVVETDRPQLPAISDRVHAADWHEREAEDMFGIHIAGHPFLGDFVLHDNDWREAVAPMRRSFDATQRLTGTGVGVAWRPRRILREPGSLMFPVGPIWGDYHEAGLWLLETTGELIRQAHSRLFYKYRGVEKIAEGQPPMQALLLAERFSGAAAVAHGLAYCQALEKLADCVVPVRARRLRIVFAELERIRYHAATIAELAGSTGLAVGKAMAQEIEETLLRLAGDVCGHRYQFGLIAPGGLAWQPGDDALQRLDHGVMAVQERLDKLESWLLNSSSFLDRIEEMGILTTKLADIYGAVGPVGRASGRPLDLRCHLPYEDYLETSFSPHVETEGDGFARLRVFFGETRASSRIVRDRLADLKPGPIRSDCDIQPGSALGWVEAPTGGAFHWVRVGVDGLIARLRISTAGFHNWHAFHRAVENAAFQDFPIILASYGLSIAENDR